MNTIFFIDEVDSTNSYATNLIKQYKPPEGTVVITANQTSGRGMMGNQWEFEQGQSFAASWIFFPEFLKAKSAFFLYIISSLAVYDFLSEKLKNHTGKLNIKWPNDILLNNKKICGILVENLLEGNRIKNSVIGIGINVGISEKFNHYASLNFKSLMSRKDLETFAMEIGIKLNYYYYELLKNNKTEVLKKSYHRKLIGFEKKIEFISMANGFLNEGINKGIDDLGRLMVQTDEQIMYFSNKDIKFIFE